MNREDINQLVDHPDVASEWPAVYSVILDESDRGAVIVATDLIVQKIDRLLLCRSSGVLSEKKVSKLLRYPGALSSFAAKLDVAAFAGMIDRELYTACTKLRELRNSVAHSRQEFLLSEHYQTVLQMAQLRDGIGEVINHTACELLIDGILDVMMDFNEAVSVKYKQFNTREECCDFIQRNSHLLNYVDDCRRPRIEFALTVLIMTGLLNMYSLKL